MDGNNYETANLRRWGLILLNFFFFIGTFFPMLVGGNVWNIRGLLSSYNVLAKGKSGAITFLSLCITLCVVLLVIVPIVHILKLFGLLGESRRNSRKISSMLSFMELVGVFGIPAFYYCYLTLMLSKQISFSAYLDIINTWTYIWLVLTIIALVLSERLLPTDPIFAGLTQREKKSLICNLCGRRNPLDANFCMGCSNPLSRPKENSEDWFCVKCGTKNSGDNEYCKACGVKRPKEY